VAAKSGKFQAVVVGVSAGGLATLEKILPTLPSDFGLSVMIVQHMAAGGGSYLVERFSAVTALPVKEAVDKEHIAAGTIYFAPADYHLLVESGKTLALSADAKVNYSRPSIDVLFETAAEAFCSRLIGIILTGANSDGASGLARVKELGGTTVVQTPSTAEVDIMPLSAMKATTVDYVIPPEEMGALLMSLDHYEEE
jgi:two-component system, chemotaxis family, protein-glutamate methylesterase/glutaminase